jgi:hypothetical protein
VISARQSAFFFNGLLVACASFLKLIDLAQKRLEEPTSVSAGALLQFLQCLFAWSRPIVKSAGIAHFNLVDLRQLHQGEK